MLHRIELERKFLVERAFISDVPRIARSLFGAPHEEIGRYERAIYFDAAAFPLWRAGYTLRVRNSREGWEQVAKANSREPEAGEDLRRSVWIWPLTDSNLMPSRLAELWKSAGVTIIDSGLAPVFETHLYRTTLLLEVQPGVLMEMCIDLGELCSPFSTVKISEIELELKAGNESAFENAAKHLCRVLPLVPHRATKADLGYAEILRHEAVEGNREVVLG